MRSLPRWILRGVVVALLLAALAAVARRFASPGGAGVGLLPAIGGDTWPPVPVKDSRPV